MFRFFRRFPTAAAALTAIGITSLAACSPNIQPHGDLPQADRLAQIVPGRTKSDVLTLLGTPSTTFALGGEHWYYISNQTEDYFIYKVHEVERVVIVIDFDKSGKVSSVRKLGLKDGKEIEMVSNVTPTISPTQSMIGELFGDIGRFSDKDTKQ